MRKVEHECGIYAIYNTFTNKAYIGKSKDIRHRWHEHMSNLNRNKHNNPSLQEDWNNQNGKGFVCYPLILVVEEELSLREMEMIALYNTTDPRYGYNSVGGQNGLAKSSELYLANKSSAMKKHYQEDPEAINKRREATKKTTSTPEYKAAQSAKAKEIHQRQEVKAKLRAIWDSEEYRSRISESHKGLKPSVKTVQKFMERISKPVKCVETGIVYPSARAAARTLPGNKNVQAAAEGVRKTAGGYHWVYVENEKDAV